MLVTEIEQNNDLNDDQNWPLLDYLLNKVR
jgi:hypothetical protein